MGVGVEQQRSEYRGGIEGELMLAGGHKGALRNEQLFVGWVGVQQAGHLPPSPQSHLTPSMKPQHFLFPASHCLCLCRHVYRYLQFRNPRL